MSSATLEQILDAVKASNAEIKLLNNKLDNVNSQLTTKLTSFINQVTERCDTQDKKIGELELKCKKTNEELSVCQTNLKNVKEKINKVEERVLANEGHNRRLNLIFQNVEETADENIMDTLKQVMINKLKIPKETVLKFLVRDVHRLGRFKRNNSENVDQIKKHRAIIIAFVLQDQRNLVFQHAKNLAGSNISLKVDLPAEWSKEREYLLVQRKRIKDHNKNLLAIITYKTYRPILIVKINGEMTTFMDNMDLDSLQMHSNISNNRAPQQ